jgi:hypothetical protein
MLPLKLSHLLNKFSLPVGGLKHLDAVCGESGGWYCSLGVTGSGHRRWWGKGRTRSSTTPGAHAYNMIFTFNQLDEPYGSARQAAAAMADFFFCHHQQIATCLSGFRVEPPLKLEGYFNHPRKWIWEWQSYSHSL